MKETGNVPSAPRTVAPDATVWAFDGEPQPQKDHHHGRSVSRVTRHVTLPDATGRPK